ncbi:unnamed protein product [Dovyalis caffra]|uniref:Uncharacterized protein n=1 Tax=Dovyalis caffra TaxID=77055 RepID=A0AAV1S0Y5_9ROSI|nr:unnamed protein product [Dovyalis caffra]
METKKWLPINLRSTSDVERERALASWSEGSSQQKHTGTSHMVGLFTTQTNKIQQQKELLQVVCLTEIRPYNCKGLDGYMG